MDVFLKALELLDFARPQNGWDALIKCSLFFVIGWVVWLKYRDQRRPGGKKGIGAGSALLLLIVIQFGGVAAHVVRGVVVAQMVQSCSDAHPCPKGQSCVSGTCSSTCATKNQSDGKWGREYLALPEGLPINQIP